MLCLVWLPCNVVGGKFASCADLLWALIVEKMQAKPGEREIKRVEPGERVIKRVEPGERTFN